MPAACAHASSVTSDLVVLTGQTNSPVSPVAFTTTAPNTAKSQISKDAAGSVPVPGAMVLFGTGLIALALTSARSRRTPQHALKT